MVRRIIGGLALVVAGCASIAGLEGTEGQPRPSTESDATEAGAPAAPEPIEKPATTFTCGTYECVVGKHACCVQNTIFTCADVVVGCTALPAEDGGAPPPSGPPLNCTTYNNCGDNECCYDLTNGAVCRESCSSGQVRLCRLGIDGCGDDAECRAMTTAPLLGIGQCTPTGGGSSGGGNNGPGGGGWGH